MGSIGATEIIVIALIAILLFGANRIADVGKGLGQGIKNFKAGLKDEEEGGDKKGDGESAKSDAKDSKEAKAKET